MNKGDLITAIADSADISKSSAAEALDATLGAIGEALARGDTVSLVGFGRFAVKAFPARMGRNPKTGAPLQIKASKSPGFKPGKTLKDLVNN